jgi:hypothetical protein
LAIFLSVGLPTSFVLPVSSQERPDWTERVSFSWVDVLYFVGVASNAKSIEEGRQKAFEAGKREIENYLQGATLKGLTIHTERTWEESQADGSVTVWRLLRVSQEDLRKAPAKRSAQEVKDTKREPPWGDPYELCRYTYGDRHFSAWVNCNLNYPLLP